MLYENNQLSGKITIRKQFNGTLSKYAKTICNETSKSKDILRVMDKSANELFKSN